MNYPEFRVHMFGTFSLRWNGLEISDTDNRMKKIWLLLAYLIYRRAPVSQEELTALLWENEEDRGNPAGALKTMFYRARTLLNKLGDNAGQTLILRQEGGYVWNPEVPTVLDTDEFDALCQSYLQSDGQPPEAGIRALELYQGGFLAKLSTESWTIPIAAYFHQLYLDTAEQVLSALEEQEQWEQAAGLCAAALKLEPYSEDLYCHLMRCQIASGDSSGAVASYETMSELLFSTFGVMLSDESRALYRTATRVSSSAVTHISNARELLREESAPTGAMFCEYDFFRVLYQAQARAIVRSGDTIHIALLSLTGRRGTQLARRSIDRAAENLKQLLIGNLRQGDIITQCSATQFLIMLPQANYENSCMVCDRLLRAFARQYPHSPADIHYSVQPLEPASNTERR